MPDARQRQRRIGAGCASAYTKHHSVFEDPVSESLSAEPHPFGGLYLAEVPAKALDGRVILGKNQDGRPAAHVEPPVHQSFVQYGVIPPGTCFVEVRSGEEKAPFAVLLEIGPYGDADADSAGVQDLHHIESCRRTVLAMHAGGLGFLQSKQRHFLRIKPVSEESFDRLLARAAQ